FFFSSRRRHTRFSRDWSSDVCSSDLNSIGVSVCKAVKEGVLNDNPIFCDIVSVDESSELQLKKIDIVNNEANNKVFFITKAFYRSEERRVGKECKYRVTAD